MLPTARIMPTLRFHSFVATIHFAATHEISTLDAIRKPIFRTASIKSRKTDLDTELKNRGQRLNQSSGINPDTQQGKSILNNLCKLSNLKGRKDTDLDVAGSRPGMKNWINLKNRLKIQLRSARVTCLSEKCQFRGGDRPLIGGNAATLGPAP